MSETRETVYWGGKPVGTLPVGFDPLAIRSKSFFYDPRPDDFVRDGDAWVATHRLGPGDLEAVPGFQWDNSANQSPPDKTEEAFSAIGFALLKGARQ